VQWSASRRPSRLAGGFATLGDLDATRVGWSERGGRIGRSETDVARVVTRTRTGRERVLYRELIGLGLTASELKGPQFDGATTYWSIGGPSEEADRCRIGRLTPAGHLEPRLLAGFSLCVNASVGGPVDFAVDAGTVFYAGERGVLRADRTAWRRCTLTSDGCRG
jgi:hypothetical protein